jgi:glycosyltransferase involved in cell wall biosynthesis
MSELPLLRVIQLITELAPAGAERIVADLGGELTRRGHEVTVLSLAPLPVVNRSIVEALAEAKVSIESLELSKSRPWRALELAARLRRLEPDVVHSHLIHPNLLSRLAAPGPRRYALINTVHVAEKRRGRGVYFSLDRLTLDRCDAHTAVSGATADYHAQRLGCDVSRFEVIENGIRPPLSLGTGERARLRSEWGVDGADLVLGAVGRLAAQKGFDTLLATLAALPEPTPDERWALVILGEGPERHRLERLARGLPRHLDLRLPGYRSDAARAASAFDLFVMPSRYEGFGLSLLEAMTHGLPVICSRAPPLPDLIARSGHGESLDFESDDAPRALAAAIARWRARGLGPAYTARSVTDMTDEYLALYRRLRSS